MSQDIIVPNNTQSPVGHWLTLSEEGEGEEEQE